MGVGRLLNRIVTRKNALLISSIAITAYALLDILYYMMDITVPRIIAYVVVSAAVFLTVLYLGREGIALRPDWMQALLIAFFAWYLIGCIARNIIHQNDFVNINMQPLIDTAIIFFMIFPVGRAYAKGNSGSRTIKVLVHILLLGWSAFMLAVIVTVFQGKTIATLNEGMIGMQKYQFLYLNCYYNTTGMLELIFTCLCFFMTLRSKAKWMKAAYGFAALVNYTALVLSNSRTATYSTMIGIVLMSGIGAYASLGRKDRKRRVIYTVLTCILAAGGLYLLRQAIFHSYWACVKTFVGDGELTISGQIRDLSDGTVSTFTGRTDIWYYAFKGIINSPQNAIFGVTPVGVIQLIKEISNGKWDVFTHNQFIEIGVANGIPGFAIMAAWFSLVLKDIWKMIVVRKDRSLRLCIPVIILTLGLANFFESTLLYYGYLSGYVFFFLCGYLHGMTRGDI